MRDLLLDALVVLQAPKGVDFLLQVALQLHLGGGVVKEEDHINAGEGHQLHLIHLLHLIL